MKLRLLLLVLTCFLYRNLSAQDIIRDPDSITISKPPLYQDLGITATLGVAPFGSSFYSEDELVMRNFQLGAEYAHNRLLLRLQGGHRYYWGINSKQSKFYEPLFYYKNTEQFSNIDFQLGYNFLKSYSRSRLFFATGLGYCWGSIGYYDLIKFNYGTPMEVHKTYERHTMAYLPVQLNYEFRLKPRFSMGLVLFYHHYLGDKIFVKQTVMSFGLDTYSQSSGDESSGCMSAGLVFKYYILNRSP